MLRLFLFLLAVTFNAGSGLSRDNRPGSFDYYVLSLSWSPSFCGSAVARGEDSQCGPGRRFAFVVHGLWPQFQAHWPEFCRTDEPWVTGDQIKAMMDIMPSKKLIIHEWRKHGSCSGLTQRAYFETVRSMRDKLRIPARYLSPNKEIVTTPEQLARDFTLSNKELSAGMISVQCGNARDSARLAEVRICLDRRGDFTPCGSNENRRCRARELILPEVR